MLTPSDILAHFGKLTVLYETDGSIVLLQRSFGDQNNIVVLSPAERTKLARMIVEIPDQSKETRFQLQAPNVRIDVEVSAQSILTLSRTHQGKTAVVVDQLSSVKEWANSELE